MVWNFCQPFGLSILHFYTIIYVMSSKKLKDNPPSGALAERIMPDGRRKLKLTRREREALRRQQQAEAAAVLFLDINANHSWSDIAQELGITIPQLRDLTKSPEFDKAYNDMMVEIGHDPRYKAAQATIADMLFPAVTELKNLLTSPNTADGVKLKAIEKVFSLNGLNAPAPQQSDRQAMVEFLINMHVSPEAIGIPIPTEYLDAAKKFQVTAPQEVVDGEFKEVAPEQIAAVSVSSEGDGVSP